MKCDKNCLACEYEDCMNDRVYAESSIYKNRPEAQKERQRMYAKRERDKAKAKGYCTTCRKCLATYGSKCYLCYIRQKRYDKAKYDGRRMEWKEKGRCYFCGDTVFPGKKVCERHLKILRKNIAACNRSENTMKARNEFRKHTHSMIYKQDKHR